MERTEDITNHAGMEAALGDVAGQSVESASQGKVGAVGSAESAVASHDSVSQSVGTEVGKGEPALSGHTETHQADTSNAGVDAEYDGFFEAEPHAMSKDGSDPLKWMDRLEKKKSGETLETLKNCEEIFMNDKALINLFGKNIFTEKTEFLRDTPWRPLPKPASGKSALWQQDTPELEFRNTDSPEFYTYMSKKYDFNKQKLIDQCVSMFAARNPFHPVRDYLDNLEWDQQNRIDTLFSDYFGLKQTDYLRFLMRKTLVAAVKRICQPGCQFDSMLTLYGPQGCGKSSFWANLAGRWYSDLPVSIATKDALQTFQGAWIIEMSELAALNATNVEKYKAVLTRRDDRFRKHFEKEVESHLRQCIFVGTTNRPDFLKDNTGNRRFWVVDVTPKEQPKKSIWTDLPREADQIWAEAKMLYDTNAETLFLEGPLAEEAARIQDSFMAYDPMRDAIEQYLARPITEDWWSMTPRQHLLWLKDSDNVGTVKRTQVCLKEITYEALSEIVPNPNKTVLNEISAIVTSIACDNGERWHRPEHSRRIQGYGKQKYFELY